MKEQQTINIDELISRVTNSTNVTVEKEENTIIADNTPMDKKVENKNKVDEFKEYKDKDRYGILLKYLDIYSEMEKKKPLSLAISDEIVSKIEMFKIVICSSYFLFAILLFGYFTLPWFSGDTSRDIHLFGAFLIYSAYIFGTIMIRPKIIKNIRNNSSKDITKIVNKRQEYLHENGVDFSGKNTNFTLPALIYHYLNKGNDSNEIDSQLIEYILKNMKFVSQDFNLTPYACWATLNFTHDEKMKWREIQHKGDVQIEKKAKKMADIENLKNGWVSFKTQSILSDLEKNKV